MKRINTAHALLATTGIVLALAGCSSGSDEAGGPSPDAPATSETTSAAPPTSEQTDAPADASSAADSAHAAPKPQAQQPPQDPDYCTSANLSLSLGQGEGAAGTVYRPLVFTNVGDVPCVLHGFPGVSYVAGDDGHQVGKPAEHTGEKSPAITLNPGEVAHADVGFAQVRNYVPQTCSPTEVRGLRVYPPHETASMFVEVPGTGCARTELSGNQLTVTSIEKGAGYR
jgi:hypothetical protein